MSTRTSPPAELDKRSHRRGREERDFWMDLFESYSESLVDSTLETHDFRPDSDEMKDQLRDVIKFAAELAEQALLEMQVRFKSR